MLLPRSSYGPYDLMAADKCNMYSGPMQSWWRHQMETFSALLAICVGKSPVTGEFHAQRPVARSFDVFFDLRLNEGLSEQWRGCWFETQSRPLWRHCNGYIGCDNDTPYGKSGSFRGQATCDIQIPNSTVHWANMGHIWVLSAPDGPHVGPMNFAIWDGIYCGY